MDVESGGLNIAHQTVRSILDSVGESQNMTNRFSASIYKAPPTFRDLNPSSFTPRVVSIGPLHREDKNLQRFEVRKAAFVHDLLCRRSDSSPTETLTACAHKVSSMIEKIKRSYADMKFKDDVKLTKMMVMDACFILEFIHEMPKYSNLRLQDQHIPYDLLLLENQIPFFVLKGVYECIIQNFDERLSLTAFIHPLVIYTNIFQGKIKVGGGHSYANYDHILGYLYHCYQPTNYISLDFPGSAIHSAVELDRAGIKFKPNQDAKWPMEMEVRIPTCSSIFWFFLRPTLSMPVLRIDDFTELVFRNLIAYEQLYAVYPHVTSYAMALDMLIDAPEDVARLVSSKVLVNHIGSNEEATHMINGICKEVAPKHFYYTEEWKQMDTHFNQYWPRTIVKLKNTYFNSPWSSIALFAGIVLFVLTTIQTIYAVKSA